MLGLGLQSARATYPWWPEAAAYAADFVNNRYMRNGVPVDRMTAIGFSRTSPKLAQDRDGVWRSFANNIPAATNSGLSLEPAATNMVANNGMVGAVTGVVGSGGALPTGWLASAFDTVTVQSIGTEDGLPYIELRLQSSNGSGATKYVTISAAQDVPALINQQWTASCFYKRIAGVWYPDIGVSFLNVAEIGDSILYRVAGRTGDMTTRTRLAVTWTTDRPGTITLRMTIVLFSVSPGDSVDVTTRIYAPQLAIEPKASSPIITSGAAATRVADMATLLLPSGTFMLTQTFADASIHTTAGVSGVYQLPSSGLKSISRIVGG